MPRQPDFQDLVTGPVPSLLMGETGILLVAHTLAPAAWQEKRLLSAVRRNAANPSRELMWGSPGTMIAARTLAERTGAEHWRQAWRESADLLLAQWHDDLWEQDLYGSTVRYLGPAHGFAGNVLALAQGDLLDAGRRTELERRAIATAHDLCPVRRRALPVASDRRRITSRQSPAGAHAVVPRRAGNRGLARRARPGGR